ncbi:MAG: diacylglycerol kinase family protein, partial [Xanthobacteraceae bacterium]
MHNPTAGTKGHDKNTAFDALRFADYKVAYVCNEADAKIALRERYDLVVVAGGDGTVGRALCNLADRSIPIAVMPFGSANNIARSLGVAGTPVELAEQLRTGRVQPFYLMNVAPSDGATQMLVEGLGVGLMPALIKLRAKGEKAGGAEDIRRGRRALEEILHQIKPLDVEIDIDGKPWSSDLISVDILNIPFTGPALPLAHAADPTNKLLEVVALEGDQR